MAQSRSTAVVLINLGTPEKPTPSAVRSYLGAFLWDKRVVEIPRVLWWLILNGIILTFRPAKVAKLYAQIWTPDGSPMRVILRQQAKKLSLLFAQEGVDHIQVEGAMTYGLPNIRKIINKMLGDGVEKIIFLPLYPQYSATTTAAAFDQIARTLADIRNIPEIVFIKSYHDHPDYIAALANSIRESGTLDDENTRLVFSFHGIPQRFADAGDPYPEHCRITADLVAKELSLTGDRWEMAFQSRFGKAQWLEPYLDKRLEQLPQDGIKSVAICCPAFSADCLETLEEIAVENKETFMAAGGDSYHYIPALNDGDDHIDCLKNIVVKYL